MKQYIQSRTLWFLPLFLLLGCDKFLAEKSDKSLAVPATVEDLQALLNSYGSVNADYIASGEVSSDDYYLNDADYNGLAYESDKRLYTWRPDYVTRPQSSAGDEWYNCYRTIFIFNSVLQGLEDNNLTGTKADKVKGQALFFRASRYLDGVQVWALAYNKETADTDLGMVLRVDPDMNIPSVRSSVQETYDLIIKDLMDAVVLLPNDASGRTLPTKSTAYALLARTYLFMGEYGKALQNAVHSFENTRAETIDFNTLDPDANFPIPATNFASQELMLWTTLLTAHQLRQAVAKINIRLYDLYDDGDLRKVIYFRQNADHTYSFKGTHHGYFSLTNSPTPAEMYLTIAECNTRLGNLSDGAKALNQLLVKRYKSDEFVPYVFTNSETALQTVLKERRKELVMRGLRWPDIKRLNRDGADIMLTRTVNGETFSLPPNDPRYAIAISEDVIEIGGVQQNPR